MCQKEPEKFSFFIFVIYAKFQITNIQYPHFFLSTVATYADIYGVTQFCAILCGPLLGLAIAAGKRELRTLSALSRRCHTLRKNLVKWGKSPETQRIHDVTVQKVSPDQHVGSVVMAEIRELRGCQVSVIFTVVTLIVFGILVLIPNTLVQVRIC